MSEIVTATLGGLWLLIAVVALTARRKDALQESCGQQKQEGNPHVTTRATNH